MYQGVFFAKIILIFYGNKDSNQLNIADLKYMYKFS